MALDSLAPDQRAVVQLVLQRKRSYAELAGVLGIPEDSVRRRAQTGLATLGAERPLSDADREAVADWLLNQQDDGAREATEALVAGSAPAREWAAVVAEELRPVARHGLPEIPANGAKPAAQPAAEPEPEPIAEAQPVAERQPAPAPSEPPASSDEPVPAAGPTAAPSRPRRTRRDPGDATTSRAPRSKLRSAVPFALLAVLLAAVVGWIVSRDAGETKRAAGPATTARATATPQQQTLAQLPLESVGRSKAEGLVQVNAATGGQVGFTLVARDVPPNTASDAYAVWLTGHRRPPLRLGFAGRVGKDGTLATSGPEAKTDPAAFTRGLTTYAQMVVSKETSDTVTKPSRILLRASLAQLRSAAAP